MSHQHRSVAYMVVIAAVFFVLRVFVPSSIAVPEAAPTPTAATSRSQRPRATPPPAIPIQKAGFREVLPPPLIASETASSDPLAQRLGQCLEGWNAVWAEEQKTPNAQPLATSFTFAITTHTAGIENISLLDVTGTPTPLLECFSQQLYAEQWSATAESEQTLIKVGTAQNEAPSD